MKQNKITLIAEIGENYLGRISLAKKLIILAKKAGADFAKFQSYNEMCLRKNDPEYDWFKKVALKDSEHKALKKFSIKNKINFLSSPFSLERAKFLCENLGLKTLKVASSKSLDLNLLNYLNKKCNKVYFSTGMLTLQEIKKSISKLNNVDVSIMHCVSEYPLKIQNANLLAITKLRQEFLKHEIGYSDHTIGNYAVYTAVSLGASVIEKHFTINKKLKGTDHILSADFKDLKNIRKNIDQIKTLLGREEKKPSRKEKKIKKFMMNRFI